MAKPWARNETDHSRVASGCRNKSGRRYFHRAASKARRVGLRADQRRQEAEERTPYFVWGQ